MRNFIARLKRSDYTVALLIVVGWQILLTFIGWWIAGGNILDHTVRWDSGWYLTVIRDHYLTNPASPAFYPLFPLCVWLITTLSFGFLNTIVAGYLLNTLCIWLIIVAITKIAPYYMKSSYRYLVVAFILLSPAAFFLHMFYSEAPFMAIGLWAYLFALRRQWWFMGIALGVLTAGRLPAILFIILCGLEYLRSHTWSLKKAFNLNILAFALAPLGFIAYALYLRITNGSFFAMFDAYHKTNDWAYQVFNPNIFETIARVSYQILRSVTGQRPFDHDIIVNHLIPLACLVLLASTSLYAIVRYRKKMLPLAIFGFLGVVMFSLNSNLISVHRYTLPCVVIYIVLAKIFSENKKIRPYIGVLVAILFSAQVYLYLSILGNKFSG